MIKANITNDDASAFAVNDLYYADAAASVAVGAAAAAANTPIAADLLAASYELTFVGLSRIDGFPIFRVRANTGALVANPGDAASTLVGFASYNQTFNYAQGAETAASTIYNSIISGGEIYGLARVAGVRPALAAVLVGGGGAGSNNIASVNATPGLSLVKALEDHISGFSGNAFQPANDPATGGPQFAAQNANGLDPYQRGVGESTVDNVM
jgi:hypothetical protein